MPDKASFALIANLVGSRKEKDRIGLSLLIKSALEDLALRWPDAWIAPPTTTRGVDEISAVMESPRHAFDFAVGLNLFIWPARFRMAIASGHLNLAPTSTNAGDSHSQAFHLASTALRRAEKSRLLFAVQLSELPMATWKLIESSARLHSNIMHDWKPSRAAAAAAVRKTATQQAAAESLGIRQQSVSEALRAAHAKDLVSLEDAIRTCLTILPT